MRDLVPGERAAVEGRLTLTLAGPLRPPLELALIALDRGRTASGAFPPIDSTTREMRPAARFEDGGRVVVDLAQVPAGVDRLALVAYLATGPGRGLSFRDFGGLAVVAGDLRYAVDLAGRDDTALILIEVYRYGEGWRLAANGQGFLHGLPAVASAYGVDPGWARRLTGTDERPHEDGRLDAAPPRSGNSTGSGVAIDRQHVLSNAHVVEDARTITVVSDGRTIAADLVFADPRNDLALLRVAEVLPAVAQFRAGLDLHLGEDIVVLGFPLQGLLGSGPQASGGNIAGLCGVGNDSSMFQFTAPIASGNSGGPILDLAGQLVGLVCASLNLDRVRSSGGNAENVNFGIKGAMVRSFLDAFGLTPQLGGDAVPIPRAAMVRAARETIFRINCTC